MLLTLRKCCSCIIRRQVNFFSRVTWNPCIFHKKNWYSQLVIHVLRRLKINRFYEKIILLGEFWFTKWSLIVSKHVWPEENTFFLGRTQWLHILPHKRCKLRSNASFLIPLQHLDKATSLLSFLILHIYIFWRSLLYQDAIWRKALEGVFFEKSNVFNIYGIICFLGLL